MLQSLFFKQGLLVSEEKTGKDKNEELDYSDPVTLAKVDTAIEIMAARIGICMQRIFAEEEKPEAEQNQELLSRLSKEMVILYAERDRMYGGDKKVHNKILNQYSKEVKDYYLGKKKNVR